MKLAGPLAALGVSSLALAQAASAVPVPPPGTNAINYTANLAALNHSQATGQITLAVTENKAVITETASGLADKLRGKSYPHMQQIRIDGHGQCPTMADDRDHDGTVSDREGAAQYGPAGATLSTSGDTSPKAMTNPAGAPHGQSFKYSRTIVLDAKTADALKGGKAVVVVDGLDPASLSAKARAQKSDSAPSLPAAVTAPALCGVLAAGEAGAGIPKTPVVPAPNSPDEPKQPPHAPGGTNPGSPDNPGGSNPSEPGGPTTPGGTTPGSPTNPGGTTPGTPGGPTGGSPSGGPVAPPRA